MVTITYILYNTASCTASGLLAKLMLVQRVEGFARECFIILAIAMEQGSNLGRIIYGSFWIFYSLYMSVKNTVIILASSIDDR